jgi:hypothetical protein
VKPMTRAAFGRLMASADKHDAEHHQRIAEAKAFGRLTALLIVASMERQRRTER